MRGIALAGGTLYRLYDNGKLSRLKRPWYNKLTLDYSSYDRQKIYSVKRTIFSTKLCTLSSNHYCHFCSTIQAWAYRQVWCSGHRARYGERRRLRSCSSHSRVISVALCYDRRCTFSNRSYWLHCCTWQCYRCWQEFWQRHSYAMQLLKWN